MIIFLPVSLGEVWGLAKVVGICDVAMRRELKHRRGFKTPVAVFFCGADLYGTDLLLFLLLTILLIELLLVSKKIFLCNLCCVICHF